MAKKIQPRCGASAPDSDARRGWHWCYYPKGHAGRHEDDYAAWEDNDTVEVCTVAEIATVHDHEHYFGTDARGDAMCSMDPECTLTFDEHMRQQAWWEQEYVDTCGHCGHHKDCHTTSLPEEGGRDYCTECESKDEFHTFDKEPEVFVPSPAQLHKLLRELYGPALPQERLEAAVAALTASLAGPEGEGLR